jgi:putative FmdB family regulatory protein
MPLYDYKCECGAKFEDLNTIANRHLAECLLCGKMAKVCISPVRIDPMMDCPGARMTERKAMERRGRGTDMTEANRTVTDYDTQSDAHAKRKIHGENPIVSIPKGA